MDAGRPRFDADRREREQLAERFFAALRDGEVGQLRDLLAADVQVIGDGGGKAPAFTRGVTGFDRVIRVLEGLVPAIGVVDLGVEPHEVNGEPGAILRDADGRVIGTLALDILGGRIQTIRGVLNPDKLHHLGPVGDAWEINREVNRARRSST